MAELKACPFCGGEAEEIRVRAFPDSHREELTALRIGDAVPVERLGNWGREYMIPYKGCPRGRRGARGVPPEWTEEDVLNAVVKTIYAMNIIEDVEGDLWIPVAVEDLQYLISRCRENNAAPVVHGRWMSFEEYARKIGADTTGYMDNWCFCSECEQPMRKIYGWNYCPKCGAKMDGEAE